MKKFISLLGLLLIASAVFAQSFTLKTADKTPCTITLNGDFIVIEETLLDGYINRITIPKAQFTSTKAKIDSEQGGKSVINNQPFTIRYSGSNCFCGPTFGHMHYNQQINRL